MEELDFFSLSIHDYKQHFNLHYTCPGWSQRSVLIYEMQRIYAEPTWLEQIKDSG